MNAAIPELLLPDDAARVLYLSTRKLLALARRRLINHVMIEGEIFFTADDIAEFIATHRIQAVAVATPNSDAALQSYEGEGSHGQ